MDYKIISTIISMITIFIYTSAELPLSCRSTILSMPLTPLHFSMNKNSSDFASIGSTPPSPHLLLSEITVGKGSGKGEVFIMVVEITDKTESVD